MSIRHISELGTGDVDRLGLQPATGRLNTVSRIQVQQDIANTLRATGAFRAAENLGEEGLDHSAKLSRPKRVEVTPEPEDDDALDDVAL